MPGLFWGGCISILSPLLLTRLSRRITIVVSINHNHHALRSCQSYRKVMYNMHHRSENYLLRTCTCLYDSAHLALAGLLLMVTSPESAVSHLPFLTLSINHLLCVLFPSKKTPGVT
ncbi:hypothetical protein DL96DRAFT_1624360 [Flagelloscypha sp. PMI_526]|nr:hypothetical protein DL96DRAFT_1624360 [Flagelloscypha sp. PMI_526]